MLESVLFDLDGTLMETHCDLGSALNRVLEDHGQQPLPMDSHRPYVSRGALMMVSRAFNLDPLSDLAQQYWKEMLDQYEQNIAQHTKLFPGMDKVLEHIEQSNIPWGIVTNKPGKYTDKLLATLALPYKPDVVISGDTLAVKKPHPAPILEACQLLDVDPTNSIYVGDDVRDIEAGKNAETKTIAVTYGYFPDTETPENWGADWLLDDAMDIVGVLKTF